MMPPRRHLAECGSTNDVARAWAADPDDPAPHGAAVTADFQTAGRGRRGRSWDAAPGQNVLLSVVLRPAFPQADAWQLGFLSALAVADALAGLGFDAQIKWPNDVLIGGDKIAGILVETVRAERLSEWAAIAGIGLNVNQDRFPDTSRLLHPATSLRLLTARDWDVADVTEAIIPALLRWVQERETRGWESVLPELRRRLAVGAGLRRGAVTATLADVLPDGSARVRLPDGTFALWTTVEGEEGPETAPNRV